MKTAAVAAIPGEPARFDVVTEWRELDELASEWTALLARSGADELAQSPLWLGAWWHTFGALDDRALRCAIVTEGDRLIGIAPLVRRRHWYRPGIPFRRLEFAGSGEDERDEICSEYIGVVAERGYEDTVAGQLVAALASGELGDWNELVLSSMDGTAQSVAALRRALCLAGYAVEYGVSASAPYVPLPGSWEAYLAALPRASRYLVRKSAQNLCGWVGDDVRFETATTPAELRRGAAILRELHGQRWTDSGAFSSERFSAFHERVMPRLLERGALDLSWLTVRGKPIGALYNLVWNNKIYYYQSGRRLGLPTGIRPGISLHAEAIRRAIAAGRREYDFLAGSQRFKKQLSLASRPIVQLRVAKRGQIELARRVSERGIEHVREVRAWLSNR
jgi:CelD/BcsL family acetyltransferase involved in cellulose biosynthesis